MHTKQKAVALATSLILVVFFILAFADSGTKCSIEPNFSYLSCLLREFRDLAGGLIGAAGTIFAGWLAWSAVRAQIQNKRELMNANEREVMSALRLEMNEFLTTVNQSWRALDILLDDEKLESKTINSFALFQTTLNK